MHTYIITYVQIDRQMYVHVTIIIKKRVYQLGGKGSERVTGRGWKEEREGEMLYNSISANFKESLVL